MAQQFGMTSNPSQRFRQYMAFSASLKDSPIDLATRDLINLRVSQINGCAFCVDMHVKEARIHGERDLRLHHVAVWRESDLFTPRERACLAWAEALTNLSDRHIPDAEFDAIGAELSQEEVAELTLVITAINGWNRIAIAAGDPPGLYDEAFGLTAAGLA